LPQNFFVGIEPNDAAHPTQKPHIFFTQNNSSTSDDDACQSASQSFEQSGFGIAKCQLAVARENIRNGNPKLRADHFVGIMPAPASASRQLTSNRGFSCAHEADQGNSIVAYIHVGTIIAKPTGDIANRVAAIATSLRLTTCRKRHRSSP
jgi:hypothetical protein